MLRTKTGQAMGIKPGHNIADWELALTDPDLFVWTKLVPTMEAKGITSPLDQIKEVQALFQQPASSFGHRQAYPARGAVQDPS